VAEVKTLAAEGSEILGVAFGIGALDTGDPLSVIAAGDEAFGDFADALEAELSVRSGIGELVELGELCEMLLEDSLKDVGATLRIGRRFRGRGRQYGG
jgi:hypothetical protein